MKPAAEIRVGWFLLGILILVAYSEELRSPLVAVVGLTWLGGTFVVASRERWLRVRACWQGVVADRAVRMAVVILLAYLTACVLIFSLPAALFAAAVLGVLALGSGLWFNATAVRGMLLGGVAGVGAVGLVLAGGELLLHLPTLQRRFGTPAEIAKWEDRYDGLWRQNVFGFRSPYEQVSVDSGVLRVVALGDSFTWGDKIPQTDSTWPAVLERELQQRIADGRVEVINMGRRGFTTVNEVELLNRLGWQFDPDLVAMQFLVNDVLPSGPDFRSEGSTWLCPARSVLPARFQTGLVRASALRALLDRQVTVWWSGADCEYLRLSDLYEDESVYWIEMRQAMEALGDSARARHVPAVLLLFPQLSPGRWTMQTYPYREVHEKVASAAGRAGICVLDLLPVMLAEGDLRGLWATSYDGHLGPAGHRLAARALASFLEEMELLGLGTAGVHVRSQEDAEVCLRRRTSR